MEPADHCAIFGWDKKTFPLSAALLNSSFIQGFELDDWHSEAPLHSNSILLPSLFSATSTINKSSTSKKVDRASFHLAYLAGLEVGPRVGYPLHATHMLTMSWHSGSVFGPSASASASAISKLLDLSSAQIEDALGIACTQACGLMSAQYESERGCNMVSQPETVFSQHCWPKVGMWVSRKSTRGSMEAS